MKKSIIGLLIFMLYMPCIAQDTLTANSNQLSFRWPSWRLDGKKIHRSKLGFEILKVEAAVPWYQKSQRNKTKAYTAMGGAVILVILGKTETDIASPRFGKNNLGYKIGSIVAAASGIFFISRATKFLKKAVRIHNEQRLIY